MVETGFINWLHGYHENVFYGRQTINGASACQ